MPKHIPVLLEESVESLDLETKQVFVDATYGGGGHTREVLRRFPHIRAITIDQNPGANADITGNFRDLDIILGDVRPDAILFDLGFSSIELEGEVPGLSFQRNEDLDMRLSGSGPTAAEILNSWDEHAIELVLRGFGEESYSKKIAQAIVERRKTRPFQTTFDLVEVVESAKPRRRGDKIHPATKTFQALRIAVNDELTALEEGLEKGWRILNPKGRIAVISFHSLEDRIVKSFFRNKASIKEGRLINKKPITPSEEEIGANPRSRSAKLRVIEKT